MYKFFLWSHSIKVIKYPLPIARPWLPPPSMLQCVMEMWPSPPLEEPPHKVEVSEMGDFENRDGRHTCRVVRLLSINDKYVRIDYVEMAIQII